MKKKKHTEVAKLSEDTLFEYGNILKAQQHQVNALEAEHDDIIKGIDFVENENKVSRESADKADELVRQIEEMSAQEKTAAFSEIRFDEEADKNIAKPEKYEIKKVRPIELGRCWAEYCANVSEYSDDNAISAENDPFLELLPQKDYEKIYKETYVEFERATRLNNSVDIKFLAIATALQTVKALLFPMISSNLGYGQRFDSSARKKHNEFNKFEEEKQNQFLNRNKNHTQQNANWVRIINDPVPYDVIKGSKDAFNEGLLSGIDGAGRNRFVMPDNIAAEVKGLSGNDHRLRTLGHDPILGWIFGTANILTYTVTLNTFATYNVSRVGFEMLPGIVPAYTLGQNVYDMVKSDSLNLPAALFKQGIHLESDKLTKKGLPVPVISTFAPDFAGKLYRSQYDFLCLSRDISIVGVSGVISLIIDMIITLAHGLFFDEKKDVSRDLFEVRTRKILLISNAIASASNIIYSAVTHNPKALDIGGLLVTISRLFGDIRFITDLKKEFIENKIYESIESNLIEIESNGDKILEFEYNNLIRK